MVYWPQRLWVSIWCLSPHGQGDTCCHITMELPKFLLKTNPDVADHPVSIGKPSWRDDTICSGLVSEPKVKQTGTPWSWWEKLMGKTPILCGTREQEHLIPIKVSPGGTGGDTQHLGTFVAVTSSMAPKSANLLCIPNTQDTICSEQSAVCVGEGVKGVILLLLWADLWLVYLYASPTLLEL